MNCRDVNRFLADYLDGALPWYQRLLFKVHLLLCRQCRRYLASYVTTVRVTKSLGERVDIEVGSVPDELVRAILSVRRSSIEGNVGGQPTREGQ